MHGIITKGLALNSLDSVIFLLHTQTSDSKGVVEKDQLENCTCVIFLVAIADVAYLCEKNLCCRNIKMNEILVNIEYPTPPMNKQTEIVYL